MNIRFGIPHTLRWVLVLFLLVTAVPGNVAANHQAVPISSVSTETTDVTFDCSTVTQIPQSECQALVDLYNSTNGASWTVKSGWLATTTPCTNWYGIACSGSRVTELNLVDNNLSGPLPATLGNLIALRELNLLHNNLTEGIPSLQNLTAIQVLNLGDNNLTGEIPTWMGNLTTLVELNLGFNRLTGSIPIELGSLSNLYALKLSENRLTGSVPAQLSNLKNLYNLSLDRNQLSGSIPPELGSMTSLGRFALGYNSLSGILPVELTNLANLYSLDVTENQITGTIPTQINKLKKLQWLSLRGNSMEGPLPMELREISTLRGIQLGGNNFSGILPSWIGMLKNLEVIDLEDNDFSGRLPSSIGLLTNLVTFNIAGNGFWGEIPSSIVNLTKLNTTRVEAHTDIGHNHLYTIRPAVIAFLNDKDPDWKDTQTALTDFFDVHPTSFAVSFITAIYDAGITGGCNVEPRLYCPDASVSRADMAIFLERGKRGKDFTPEPATGIFGDVPLGAYYAPWVEKLYEDGITAGCTTVPLNYCPSLKVSRAQMAVFLLKAKYGEDYQPPEAQHIFSDVTPGSFFEPWIEQLAAEGITAGCGVGIYCPSSPVTRAQMAVFLTRTFDIPLP
jgi:Leucine-rich repeat (LRR) protein